MIAGDSVKQAKSLNDMTKHLRDERLHRRWHWLCALILALAVIARVGGAAARYRIKDPDAGVVALMAKHMAEGKGWPVFFYGQAYMGSLEPTLSALCCRVFGIHGFAVNLGTALFGILAVWAVMRWAKDVAGERAAAVAGLLCAIGPSPFAWFMVVPRGGYAAAIALALLAMWLSARISTSDQLSSRAAMWSGSLCGIFAGLAWWSNPLLTPAVVASGLTLLIGLRSCPRYLAITGYGFGFFVGSGPFWWWNARHGWESFDMLRSVGVSSVAENVAHWRARWAQLLELSEDSSWLRGVVLVAYALLGLGTLWGVLRGLLRSRRWNALVASIAPCFLFLVLANYFYLKSKFIAAHTARYLLPQFALWAFLAGLAFEHLPRTKWIRAGWMLALLVVLGSHMRYFGEARNAWLESRTMTEQDAEWARWLEQRSVEAVYSHFRYYSLNFALGERWPFTALTGERIPDICCRAERATRVAFVNNHGGVVEAVGLCGGSLQSTRIGDCRVDIPEPPENRLWKEIAPEMWARVRDLAGRDIRSAVADRDMDTVWRWDGSSAAEAGWEIILKQPKPIICLRLCGSAESICGRLATVEVLEAFEGQWRIIHEMHAVPGLYWSGPRLFWGGRRFRVEYRLPGVPIVGIRWRVQMPDTLNRVQTCQIAEVQLFEETTEVATPPERGVSDLGVLLRSAGVRRVYADRWLSSILARSSADLELENEGRCAGKQHAESADWSYPTMGEKTAMVVSLHDADQTRSALFGVEIPFSETNISNWVFFLLGDAEEKERLVPQPLYWTGYSLFRGNHLLCAFESVQRALEFWAQGDSDRVMDALARVFRDGPVLFGAANDLMAALVSRRDVHVPKEWLAEWRARTQPQVTVGARFEGGLVLEGFTVSPSEVQPNEEFNVRFYWRNFSKRYPHEWVFAHFLTGDFRFQDDYHLSDAPASHLFAGLTNAIWTVDRTVRVPQDAPLGSVDLRVGLYVPATGYRLRVRATARVKDRAVVCENVLRITAGPLASP